MRISLKYFVVVILLLGLLSVAAVARLVAQANSTSWTQPVNVSQSGAASRPAIAVAGDGSLHVVWWDAVEGEQYARTAGITSTVWTAPLTLPDIIGRRGLDPITNRETIEPPNEVRLATNSGNTLHIFWRDSSDGLFTAQAVNGSWGKTTTLAPTVTRLGTATDISGTLRLIYVRPVEADGGPAGVYLRVHDGTRWSTDRLISASPYFRAASAENLHVSVAGNGRGETLAIWNDPQLNQSLLARSDNNGSTWSAPIPLTGTQSLPIRNASIAAASDNTFILLWQDSAGGSGCSYMQRVSRDGGQTWSAPTRVLRSATVCPTTLQFMPDADGSLWAVGHTGVGPEGGVSPAMLAVWDEEAWSELTAASLNFFDQSKSREVTLSCMQAAVAGQSAAIVGCDTAGDVWAARNATELNSLIERLQPVWLPLQVVSDRNDNLAMNGLPVMIADRSGNLHAMWSESTGTQNDTALVAASRINGRWSLPAKVLRSPSSAGVTANQAEQPTLAIDAGQKVHAAWTSGLFGSLYYSWAPVSDVGSAQRWAEPLPLITPGTIASKPDLAVNPASSDIYLIYTIPYNEGRGVYVLRSSDGGGTWLTPTLVFDATAAQWPGVDKARLVYDSASQVLHAAWLRTTLPGTTGSQALYYARSSDQGQTWSKPQLIVEGQVDWPRLAIINTGQVYLAWNLAPGQSAATLSGSNTVWGQLSADGGEEWFAPSAVFESSEISGPIGLYGNSAGALYIAAVGRDASNQSALLFAEWGGQAWRGRESVPLGQGPAAGNAAALAGTSGQLEALLKLQIWNNAGMPSFEVTNTGRPVATTAATPAPTFTPVPTVTPTATPLPTATATPRPSLPNLGTQPKGISGGMPPLVLGGSVAGLLVFIAVLGITLRRRR